MTRVAIVAASAGARADLERTVRGAISLTVTTVAASIGALTADPRFGSSEVVLLHMTRGLAVRDLESLPPIPVVVLSSATSKPAWLPGMLAAGARGVLPDDSTAEEVAAAVEAVIAGLVVMPAEVLNELAAARPATAAARGFENTTSTSSARPTALTPREREIVAMLAEGLPNKSIASRLGISEHTVKTHLEALFDKLGASNRAEAVARAVRSGLLLL